MRLDRAGFAGDLVGDVYELRSNQYDMSTHTHTLDVEFFESRSAYLSTATSSVASVTSVATVLDREKQGYSEEAGGRRLQYTHTYTRSYGVAVKVLTSRHKINFFFRVSTAPRLA